MKHSYSKEEIEQAIERATERATKSETEQQLAFLLGHKTPIDRDTLVSRLQRNIHLSPPSENEPFSHSETYRPLSRYRAEYVAERLERAALTDTKSGRVHDLPYESFSRVTKECHLPRLSEEVYDLVFSGVATHRTAGHSLLTSYSNVRIVLSSFFSQAANLDHEGRLKSSVISEAFRKQLAAVDIKRASAELDFLKAFVITLGQLRVPLRFENGTDLSPEKLQFVRRLEAQMTAVSLPSKADQTLRFDKQTLNDMFVNLVPLIIKGDQNRKFRMYVLRCVGFAMNGYNPLSMGGEEFLTQLRRQTLLGIGSAEDTSPLDRKSKQDAVNFIFDAVLGELIATNRLIPEDDFISAISDAKEHYAATVGRTPREGRKIFIEEFAAFNKIVDAIALDYKQSYHPGIFIKNNLDRFPDDIMRGEAVKLFSGALRRMGNIYGTYAERELRALATGPHGASK